MSDLHLSEEQARRLWERAAQLQAEAALKEEAEEEPEADEPRRLVGGVDEEEEGYSLAHIRQAGVEVGIEPDFLELALAEEAILELEGGGESGFWDRTAQGFLNDHQGAFEVRKRFPFPGRRVWPLLEETLTSEAHDLELLEVRGPSLPEGGIAIFESPYAYERSGSLKYWSTVAEIRRYLVRVVPGEEEECVVVIQAPLRRARRVNGAAGAAIAGLGGALGGGAGIGIAGLVVGSGGMGALAIALGLTAGGVLGGERLTRAAYLYLYRWGLRSLEKAFKKTLTRIGRDLQRESEGGL